jgi:hypothetical protein
MADNKVDENDNVPHTFGFYIRPSNFTKIVSNRKTIFGIWGFIGYCAQFLLILATINVFCDKDRMLSCGGKLTGDDASAVYDPALVVLAIYHLIEWFRFIVFLTAVFLGANMISLYYILYLNTLFGIAAYCDAHARRYNDNGKLCAESQHYRAQVLVAEVVIFWTSFLIMSFP